MPENSLHFLKEGVLEMKSFLIILTSVAMFSLFYFLGRENGGDELLSGLMAVMLVNGVTTIILILFGEHEAYFSGGIALFALGAIIMVPLAEVANKVVAFFIAGRMATGIAGGTASIALFVVAFALSVTGIMLILLFIRTK